MAYKIIVSPLAEKEIEEAIDYYLEISNDVAAKFLNQVKETYKILSIKPFYRVRYKDIRAVPVKGFSFMLFYRIVENEEMLIVYSCFHTSKSPLIYPK